MSDHFSGPRALAGPAGDICDMYAFPRPERAGTSRPGDDGLPMATPASSFSDAIVCRFRLRPLTVAQDRPAFPFGPEDSELVFACSFEPPQDGANGAAPGAVRQLHHAVRTDGPISRGRRRGRAARGPARLCRPALRPVLH